MTKKWLLRGATKDAQSITADWQPVQQKLIDGVVWNESRNVPTGYGYLTEIFRSEWQASSAIITQIFQAVLRPGQINAWHSHAKTTDRFFVSYGLIHVVLYDGREDSPTYGLLNEFRLGTLRPAIITIPPKVWHGIQNIHTEISIILNLVDQAYSYENPDHWRVPADTAEIPFSFSTD